MSFLDSLSESLNNSLRKLFRLPIVDENAVKAFIKDLQRALLRADVNLHLVLKISEKVQERTLTEKLPPGVSRREHVIKVLYEELTNIMGKKSAKVSINDITPYILMLVGIQGSGKTTTCVKLARFYQKRGEKTAIICTDTYRPGAYDQLNQLAQRIQVPVYWKKNQSADKIANEGLKKFKQENFNLIIIDTAGRHRDEYQLMEEMRNLEKIIKPHEVMLILDGAIGQRAFEHARAFQDATNIGSITITKLDGSAQGGGAISAVTATGAILKFIGVGESESDLEQFDPPKFVSRILGMGDLETLMQKVRDSEMNISEEKVHRITEGKFTLKDLYEQMESLKKLGPLKKVWNMLPGGVNLPESELESAEKRMKDWKVIIQSMTKEEIENPKILSSSRIKRIARGSGRPERIVKELIQQYFTTRKMMKGLKRRHSILKKKLPFKI